MHIFECDLCDAQDGLWYVTYDPSCVRKLDTPMSTVPTTIHCTKCLAISLTEETEAAASLTRHLDVPANGNGYLSIMTYIVVPE